MAGSTTNRLALVVLCLCLSAWAQGQGPASAVLSTSAEPATIEPSVRSVGSTAPAVPDLPAPPRGKASLMGGTIRHVDHLRDQITLQVFGGGTARVLFDGRTHIERDGGDALLRDLKDGDHVYLETVLDGKAVFARNIRVVTHSGMGESSGQILSYSPETGELTLNDALSPRPLKLQVTASSEVVWQGHSIPPSELRVGTLIETSFLPSTGPMPVAGKISVLAEPGSSFVFSGRVVHLDLQSGLLVLLNSQDGKSYQVFLQPGGPGRQDNVHEGIDVTVKTQFDGTRYAVSSLDVTSSTNLPANKPSK